MIAIQEFLERAPSQGSLKVVEGEGEAHRLNEDQYEEQGSQTRRTVEQSNSLNIENSEDHHDSIHNQVIEDTIRNVLSELRKYVILQKALFSGEIMATSISSHIQIPPPKYNETTDPDEHLTAFEN